MNISTVKFLNTNHDQVRITNSAGVEYTAPYPIQNWMGEEVTNWIAAGNTIAAFSVPLSVLKETKIAELKAAAKKEIYAGYISNALGTDNLYPLSSTDQANMQSAYSSAINNISTSGWTALIQCGTPAMYIPHTAAETIVAAESIIASKEVSLTKLQNLLLQVDTADSTTIDSIVW